MCTNMRDYYDSELQGQADFYAYMTEREVFSQEEVDFTGFTDGVFGNILIENKLTIENDYYKALSQMIKYQARRIWSGKTLPRYMLANGLNDKVTYVFLTEDFIQEIESITPSNYSPSKNNSSYFTEIKPIDTFNWMTHSGENKLKSYKENTELGPKYHVNFYNIIGLSREAYKLGINKVNFLEQEIRNPNVLKDRIYAYTKSNNDEFKKIMDVLNTPLMQRELGAFYTPPVYAQKAQEMLKKVINSLPEGMNYVVIDRCAGTGNLEEGLPDNILHHFILNTVEVEESVCLAADFADKVISVTQKDALEVDVLDEARAYINDPNCAVILYENPPFSEVGAGSLQDFGEAKKNSWKNSYIYQEMSKSLEKKAVRALGRTEKNDLAHLFIWSGFDKYLTSENDYYILFDPIKYWKGQNLCNKQFVEGILCNRKAFHATASAISLICWRNIEEERDTLILPAYSENGDFEENVVIKKIKLLYSKGVYDKREFDDDYNSVALRADGTEYTSQKGQQVKAIANNNPEHAILAYNDNHSIDIDPKNFHFTRLGYYAAHGYYYRSDNFIESVAPFCAGVYPSKNWYEKGVYGKTYKEGRPDLQDVDFTRKCLLYMLLTANNKCKSFIDSTGISYRNELCFEEGTIGFNKYYELKDNTFDAQEELLIEAWKNLKKHVKDDNNFGALEYKELKNGFGQDFTLGLWQIIEDINIDNHSDTKKKTKKYKKLDTEIKSFKTKLATFYEEKIKPKLFEYELVK